MANYHHHHHHHRSQEFEEWGEQEEEQDTYDTSRQQYPEPTYYTPPQQPPPRVYYSPPQEPPPQEYKYQRQETDYEYQRRDMERDYDDPQEEYEYQRRETEQTSYSQQGQETGYQYQRQETQQRTYYAPLPLPPLPPQDSAYYPTPLLPPERAYARYTPPPTSPGIYPGEYSGRLPSPAPQPMSVPQQAQNFHADLGSQYQYQYSQCTGRKKALLIGINYIGSKNQLNGCINDVLNISSFLTGYGFGYDDMVILRDDNPPQQSMIPTKANMLRAMHWLVDDARPNDSLFFHYSGHGGQMVDFNSPQDDIYDETIYPVDFQNAGPIVNTEMHDLMVKKLPPGCRLTAIFDCCHSGSALSLPYEYGANGLVKEPNILHEAGHGLLDAYTSYTKGDIQTALAEGVSILKTLTRSEQAREESRKTRTSPADVIQLSGCKNYQTSADAVEAGRATGAMSWAFREVLKRQPRQSYHSLLVNVREVLAQKYAQKPVFSASHPVDVRLEFIL